MPGPTTTTRFSSAGEDGVRRGEVPLADDLGSQRARGGPVGRQRGRGEGGEREHQTQTGASVATTTAIPVISTALTSDETMSTVTRS